MCVCGCVCICMSEYIKCELFALLASTCMHIYVSSLAVPLRLFPNLHTTCPK